MNQEELEAVITAIMNSNDPAYTTPSGAFLEHLRNLARRLDLAGFADSCAIYTVIKPDASQFIAACVPGILCNHYFTVLPGFDYEKFIRWSVSTKTWGYELKNSFSSPSLLESAVASVCSAVNSHA